MALGKITKQELSTALYNDLKQEQTIKNIEDKIENLPQASNPNLLINGDFQVWQRGTVFNSVTKYTCDRWFAHTRTLTVSKIDNGVRVSPQGALATSNFMQIVEPNRNYENRIMTLSVKVRNVVGSGYKLRIMQSMTTIPDSKYSVDKSIDINGVGVYSITFETTSMSEYMYLIPAINMANVASGGYIDIEYMKLELGDKATTHIPRLYAEELAMCQRYYFNPVFNGNNGQWYVGHYLLGGGLQVTIPIPTSMRTTATLVQNPLGTVEYYNNGWAFATLVATRMHNSCILVQYEAQGATVGNSYLINKLPAFDAEIY